MKKQWEKTVTKMKRGVTRLLAGCLCGVMLIGGFSGTASAASKSLEDANISWDLEKNKPVTVKSAIGLSDKKGKNVVYNKIKDVGTVTLKSYKITDAKKKGYKQLTCTIVYDYNDFDWTPKMIDKMFYFELNTGMYSGPYHSNGVYDYETGAALDVENDYDVTVTYGKWKYSIRDFEGWLGVNHSIERYLVATSKITVVYPETYDNLCIVSGGYSTITTKSANNFMKSAQYSSKYKLLTHGWRVTD